MCADRQTNLHLCLFFLLKGIPLSSSDNIGKWRKSEFWPGGGGGAEC